MSRQNSLVAKAIRRAAKKPKPDFPTVLRGTTSRSLNYLTNHYLTALFDTRNMVVVATKRLVNGVPTSFNDASPTGGV